MNFKFLQISILLIYILSSTNNVFAQGGNFSHGSILEPINIDSENTQSEIYFPVTSQICYTKLSNFTNAEAKSSYITCLKLEKLQNELYTETSILRTKYAECRNSAEKEKIATTLLNYENEALKTLQKINELKKEANNKEYAYWMNASTKQISDFIKQNKAAEEAIISNSNIDKIIINTTNTTQKANQAKDNQTKSESLVYKIQVGKYKTTPQSVKNKFNKLSLIRKIDQYTNQDGYTIYTIGELYDFNDAKKMQEQLSQEGFEKTAIIAFQGGREIFIDISTGLPIVFE